MTDVAPPTGAWIEMPGIRDDLTGNAVAPPTGAWIEILALVIPCLPD